MHLKCRVMVKDCFYCLHSKSEYISNNVTHSCLKGLDNSTLKDVNECDDYYPSQGFQIGGYYSKIHFEFEKGENNTCCEMVIHSNGEFPTENTESMIKLHLCDFEQLEEFIDVWGKFLRKKGVIE